MTVLWGGLWVPRASRAPSVLQKHGRNSESSPPIYSPPPPAEDSILFPACPLASTSPTPAT